LWDLVFIEPAVRVRRDGIGDYLAWVRFATFSVSQKLRISCRRQESIGRLPFGRLVNVLFVGDGAALSLIDYFRFFRAGRHGQANARRMDFVIP
jgi:hypothetical protein